MSTFTTGTPRGTSARILAACFNIAVGVRMLLPDDILGNDHNPSYRLINAHFFGDVPFGLMLLVYGAAMVFGLRSDRAPQLVHVASWLSMLTWLVVAIDIAAAIGLSQIGTLVYTLVVALNGFAYAHVLARQGVQGRSVER